MASGRTPLAVCGIRLSRLALHFARGLVTVVFFFPLWSVPRRRSEIQRWSRKLLAILAVRLHPLDVPKPLPPHSLLVLNHVSWLDIFLIDALHPATFVAKSEIGRWPLVGTLVSRAGTLYIDRGSRRAAHETNARIAEALKNGTLVACFPEGSTTYGHGVSRFHGALFQPAIDAGAMVQPVALRYLGSDGRITEAAAYVGEDSLMKTVWAILATRAIVGELRFLPPIETHGCDRRALAKRAEASIAKSLASA